MDNWALDILWLITTKLLRVLWYLMKTIKMENVNWSSSSGQGSGNSNTEKNNDSDGLKYKTPFLDGIPKGAGFPFVFARTNSIFMKKQLIKVKNQAYSPLRNLFQGNPLVCKGKFCLKRKYFMNSGINSN